MEQEELARIAALLEQIRDNQSEQLATARSASNSRRSQLEVWFDASPSEPREHPRPSGVSPGARRWHHDDSPRRSLAIVLPVVIRVDRLPELADSSGNHASFAPRGFPLLVRRLGLISFGGPVAQIAIMHREARRGAALGRRAHAT